MCTLPAGSSAEGPVWFAERSLLVVASWTTSVVYTCNPATKQVAVLRMMTNATTANAFDKAGHLLSIEQGIPGVAGGARLGARLVRTVSPGIDGPIATVFEAFPGGNGVEGPKRFNRPNDLVVRRDGTIYFTDPWYSGSSNNELGGKLEGVYRVAADLKAITAEAWVDDIPNGIALAPDEKTLYVNARNPGRVLRFPIASDGSLSKPETFAMVNGNPDGMGTDTAGNVYVCVVGGMTVVLDPAGRQIALIGGCTNMAWGEPDMRSLFLAGAESIKRVRTVVAGMP